MLFTQEHVTKQLDRNMAPLYVYVLFIIYTACLELHSLVSTRLSAWKHYGAFCFIHRTLGTPDERLWPGVAELPDYKSSFPKWPVQNLLQVIPALSQPGADLLQVLITVCFPHLVKGLP